MSYPAPRVWLSIQRRTLDVDIPVIRIEIHVPDRRRVASKGIGDVDLGEERRDDQIHVLPAHGIQPHHRQRREACHRPGVVVPRNAAEGVVETPRDVLVRVLRGKTGSPRVVEDEHQEVGLLVADVEESWRVVHVLETA